MPLNTVPSDAIPLDAAKPAEQELVRRLKAGEDAAFEELVRSSSGRMLAVASRISRTSADAEDAVQEAFLSAFRGIANFDGQSSLNTWLHRIVVNAALARTRRASHTRERPIEDLLPVFDDGHHVRHPAPLAPSESSDLRTPLLDSLASLPEDFRTVLTLKDVFGLESKEIAASLGISDSLVRQRLHRGRQALLTLMSPHMEMTS